MALEHRRRDKGLLTEVALVLLVAVVHHLDVHVERVLPLEGGVALVALERPLTCRNRGTEGHSSEPFVAILLSGALNTRPSCTARAQPISAIVPAENAQRGVSWHQTTPNNRL